MHKCGSSGNIQFLSKKKKVGNIQCEYLLDRTRVLFVPGLKTKYFKILTFKNESEKRKSK